MEPTLSIHLFLSKNHQNVIINFKDKTKDTRGFPEVMKFIVQSLAALNNEGKAISMDQARKIIRLLTDREMDVEINGGNEI